MYTPFFIPGGSLFVWRQDEESKKVMNCIFVAGIHCNTQPNNVLNNKQALFFSLYTLLHAETMLIMLDY